MSMINEICRHRAVRNLLIGMGALASSHRVAALERQPLDDAWWTGPILAASAGTLPQGHWLVEPYVFDVRTRHADSFGSLTYINYGLSDRLTVGIIPTFGYSRVDGAPDSSHIGAGDVSVQAQWRLTQFDADSGLPATAINVQLALPTGRYDRLGDRPSDGQGSGVYALTLGWYAQTYIWLPNGRILRTRLDLADTLSRRANVDSVSVYGTPQGFRGHAWPGDAQTADLAFEYSATRAWVLALDLLYRHAGNTRVRGDVVDASGNVDLLRADSGPGVSFAFAPALEYNFNGNVGVIAGVRLIPGNRSTTHSTTPVMALNMVF